MWVSVEAALNSNLPLVPAEQDFEQQLLSTFQANHDNTSARSNTAGSLRDTRRRKRAKQRLKPLSSDGAKHPSHRPAGRRHTLGRGGMWGVNRGEPQHTANQVLPSRRYFGQNEHAEMCIVALIHGFAWRHWPKWLAVKCGICPLQGVGAVRILVAVTSCSTCNVSTARRSAARATWVKFLSDHHRNIDVRFVLAQPRPEDRRVMPRTSITAVQISRSAAHVFRKECVKQMQCLSSYLLCVELSVSRS